MVSWSRSHRRAGESKFSPEGSRVTGPGEPIEIVQYPGCRDAVTRRRLKRGHIRNWAQGRAIRGFGVYMTKVGELKRPVGVIYTPCCRCSTFSRVHEGRDDKVEESFQRDCNGI